MVGTGTFSLIKNPETLKRIKRFKQHRLAYVSLWILGILYLISLFSEIICNSEPLYLRFKGRSYFPVFAYYPEDAFLNNGKQTRPDYKKIKELPEFKSDPGHAMIFPPLSVGPYESVSPSDLAAGDQVYLALNPEIRLATVNIRQDYTVSRSSNFGSLVGKEEQAVLDILITDTLDLPEQIRNAVALRFKNMDAGAVESPVLFPDGATVVISLSDYTARSQAPKTVRLKFEEKGGEDRKAEKIGFDKNIVMQGKTSSLWAKIPEEEQAALKDKVRTRFERPVDSVQMVIQGGLYRADFEREDIRFPYAPTGRHPMGVDEAGRDVLARILYGLRISLTFGLILVFGSMVLGIGAGAVQGYYGGAVDITAQRFIEIWSALPFLYIMILMGSVYGRSFVLLLFCYGIFNWIGISYYVRAEFLRLRKQAFVEAAQCMGIPPWKIMVRHILPNAMVPVITFFPFSLVGAIGSLAALDYLGFGLPPPTPSWGELLAQAQQYRWAWWLILYPSLALFIVMLLGVFIGEGIRNAYDPRSYSRLE